VGSKTESAAVNIVGLIQGDRSVPGCGTGPLDRPQNTGPTGPTGRPDDVAKMRPDDDEDEQNED
jgi:hypothetical protein